LISREFKNEVSSFPEPYDSRQAVSNKFIKTQVSAASVLAVRAYLNMLIEKVKILEHRLLDFCLEQTVTDSFNFDTYSAIIAQSSSQVAPGEQIEIIAGVGAFSRRAKPVITIDRKIVPLSDDGAAHYILTAPGKAGKYSTPANISYTDQDGKVQWIQKDIQFHVMGN
jgi:hypothetical protein